MTDAAIFDLIRASLWVALEMSWPILGIALIAGVLIGVLQALTSIQELTLTFVPKLAAMAIVLWITLDLMGNAIISLYRDTIIPMVAGG
ncbi:MAG: flagellar biosynthetic protein FliQ [Pseudomonadota bacterium]